MQSLTVEFYTDSSFDPVQNQKVQLLRTSDYLYAFHAEGAGIGINEHSYFLFIDFDLTNITITLPTCFTSVLSGSFVSGSTVKMGEYTSQQIKMGQPQFLLILTYKTASVFVILKQNSSPQKSAQKTRNFWVIRAQVMMRQKELVY